MGDTSLPEGPVEPPTPLSKVEKEMEPSDVNAYDRDEDSKSSKIQSENMSKSQPDSKKEKADQIVEAKTHKDVGDTSLPEGPVEPANPLSEVKQEPDNLPSGYEWITCDLNSDDMCSEVSNFLKEQYDVDGQKFMVDYSSELLRWGLCTPGYQKSWRIGVRVKTSKELVAFISGVPDIIRDDGEVVKIAKINFLCVHKSLRSQRLASFMIEEVTRQVHLQNIWQAAYSLPDKRATPVTTFQYWVRMLNPEKLINAGFLKLRES
ncbi:Myristoyl-CoA:protein N-myristoyltransferase N-terminal [Arabidopsis suecica]|uniref:Myristoyl-CoA:protein N-myristoyltransferase N-terminal n=1 Tax=Arabidopsis suecica TaxID=45249 RepID=A0A8T2AKS8_ARASU|nr:Myristoyl-CoA:protein N-myristoyltransferase N-terminal [Arabidopsis suecica]